MFVERLRRGLCIHPEFSDQLSDFDKSLLWKKNFSLAGALSMVKVFLKKLFENRRDITYSFIKNFTCSFISITFAFRLQTAKMV